MSSPDVLVIGAGPAGSIAALGLARAGVRTLLIDRDQFPRPKLCGGCLTYSGTAMLGSLGLGELPVLRDAQRVEQVHLRSSSSSLILAIPPYLVIDRAELDPALVSACVSAGADFLDRTQAAVDASGAVTLRTGTLDPWTITPKVVLVADGLKGQSLREHPAFSWFVARNPRVGLGAMASALPVGCSPTAITMLCGQSGYAGIAPLHDGRAVIAAAADPAWVASNRSGPPLRSLLAELGLELDHDLHLSTTPGAPSLMRRRSSVEAEGRIFVLGDAAGYVEPFTGEGMTWAIRSALDVVPHALAALQGRYKSGDWSACSRNGHFRRVLLCRTSSRLLRSETGVRSLIRLCSTRPVAARMVSSLVRTLQSSPHAAIGAA